MIGTDKEWQEIINKYGIDFAGEMLLSILNRRIHDKESLQQPSPNLSVDTLASDKTETILD